MKGKLIALAVVIFLLVCAVMSLCKTWEAEKKRLEAEREAEEEQDGEREAEESRAGMRGDFPSAVSGRERGREARRRA